MIIISQIDAFTGAVNVAYHDDNEIFSDKLPTLNAESTSKSEILVIGVSTGVDMIPL